MFTYQITPRLCSRSLLAEPTVEERQERVQELTTHIAEYEERYDATTPAAVDALALAETGDDHSIDGIYGDLGEWATAREERQRYDRARQHRLRAEGETGSGLPVRWYREPRIAGAQRGTG